MRLIHGSRKPKCVHIVGCTKKQMEMLFSRGYFDGYWGLATAASGRTKGHEKCFARGTSAQAGDRTSTRTARPRVAVGRVGRRRRACLWLSLCACHCVITDNR